MSKVVATASKLVDYLGAVRGEMRKVTLPTMADLRQQTEMPVAVVIDRSEDEPLAAGRNRLR